MCTKREKSSFSLVYTLYHFVMLVSFRFVCLFDFCCMCQRFYNTCNPNWLWSKTHEFTSLGLCLHKGYYQNKTRKTCPVMKFLVLTNSYNSFCNIVQSGNLDVTNLYIMNSERFPLPENSKINEKEPRYNESLSVFWPFSFFYKVNE